MDYNIVAMGGCSFLMGASFALVMTFSMERKIIGKLASVIFTMLFALLWWKIAMGLPELQELPMWQFLGCFVAGIAIVAFIYVCFVKKSDFEEALDELSYKGE